MAVLPLDDPQEIEPSRVRPPHSRPMARPRVFVVDAIPLHSRRGDMEIACQRGRVQDLKTNIFPLKKQWKNDPFLVKWPLFSGPSLVFGGVFAKV